MGATTKVLPFVRTNILFVKCFSETAKSLHECKIVSFVALRLGKNRLTPKVIEGLDKLLSKSAYAKATA